MKSHVSFIYFRKFIAILIINLICTTAQMQFVYPNNYTVNNNCFFLLKRGKTVKD